MLDGRPQREPRHTKDEHKKRNKAMTKLNHIAGAALLGGLLAVAPARAAENQWPGSKAGDPVPKPKGVPAVLAKNLANFDDLDFRVYTGQQWQDLHKRISEMVVVTLHVRQTIKGIVAHSEDHMNM